MPGRRVELCDIIGDPAPPDSTLQKQNATLQLLTSGKSTHWASVTRNSGDYSRKTGCNELALINQKPIFRYLWNRILDEGYRAAKPAFRMILFPLHPKRFCVGSRMHWLRRYRSPSWQLYALLPAICSSRQPRSRSHLWINERESAR